MLGAGQRGKSRSSGKINKLSSWGYLMSPALGKETHISSPQNERPDAQNDWPDAAIYLSRADRTFSETVNVWGCTGA
jgi:hypothetical protein